MKVPTEVLVAAFSAFQRYCQDPSEENRRDAYQFVDLIEAFEVFEHNGVRPLATVLTQKAGASEAPTPPPALFPSPTFTQTPPTRVFRPTPRVLNQIAWATTTAIMTVVFFVLLKQFPFDSTTSPPQPIVPTKPLSSELLSPICSNTERSLGPADHLGTFRRDLGITVYEVENSGGNVLSNTVRAVIVDERGVWFGYYPQGGVDPIEGIGQYNGQSWEVCEAENLAIGQRANDMAIAENGDVWVVTDGFGVTVFDGTQWRGFTSQQGLAHDQGYTVVIEGDVVWVGTWEGVAKFDGFDWSVPYSVQRGDSLVDNHVHAIALHPAGEIWIGHIGAGISRFTVKGEWLHYSMETNPEALASNNIRGVVIDQDGSLWFATDGGGVSKFDFEGQEWTVFNTGNSSLPHNNVRSVAIDKHNRVWAATLGGVSYYDGSKWQLFSSVDVFDIAFGPTCNDCPYNDDHVWLGTTNLGLAHARIPPVSEVVKVESVDSPNEVFPGEQFTPRVTVRVLPGYELGEGDGLFYTGLTDDTLFGAHPVIPVREVVTVGQVYEFYDYENSFKAPAEPGTYASVWRVWQDGRYVGPEIVIEFTVTTASS